MSDPNYPARMPNPRGQFTLFSDQSNRQPLNFRMNPVQLEATAASAATLSSSLPPPQPLQTLPPVQPLQPINYNSFGLGSFPNASGYTDPAPNPMLHECTSCSGTTAVAQCVECKHFLCLSCIQLHAKVPYAREHHVQYLDDITKKVIPVRDVASQSFDMSPWRSTNLSTNNAFGTNDLLDTVSRMDQLNISDRWSEEAVANPPRSRVVGAGRYSFSSQSPTSIRSANSSPETVTNASGTRAPAERPLTEGNGMALVPINAATRSIMSSSNQLLFSHLYSGLSTNGYGSRHPKMPTFPAPMSNQVARPNDVMTPTELFALWPSNMPLRHLELAIRCPIHDGVFAYFCNTCMVPACFICRNIEHTNHAIVHMLDAIDSVRGYSDHVLFKIKELIGQVQRHVAKLERTTENVDILAQYASMNIRQSFKNYIGIIDNRETEFLIRIEQARLSKVHHIQVQLDTARQYLTVLFQSRDNLREFRRFMPVIDLMAMNNKTFLDLTYMKGLCGYMMSAQLPFHETNYFIPTENSTTFGTSLCPINVLKSWRNNRGRMYQVPITARQLCESKYRPIYGNKEVVAINHYGTLPTQVWGGPGKARGELCRPWGIACNRHGEIYVADRSNNRIQVFNVRGDFLFEFGEHGTEPGQFHKCAGIAIGVHDEVVVADKDNHRIQAFTRRGDFIMTFGSEGDLPGEFRFPWDVAVDSYGNILVSDTRNHRVQMFTSCGKFMYMWGGETEPKTARLFDSPRGVAFDPRGNLLVTDFNLHKLVMIERTSGRIRTMGHEGKELGQFLRPQGLICDDRGWLIIVDSKNFRYQVFNENGEFLWAVGRQGLPDPGYFDRPSAVCLDPEGHIIIVDSDNHRIQKF
ncbi:uncharacterized protein LOC143201698 [Rhynchophorus ferrugineus]|uniref:uncharacterized protein LOC143201698 n=1 Tax=Rhynchophorus ferrugineus TaxID=354439 RepID=UPI003FCCFA41